MFFVYYNVFVHVHEIYRILYHIMQIKSREKISGGVFVAITVKEIARLAGVSRGTVDRALKGRDGINRETKERILKIAQEHNYTPNLIGKALVYSKHPIKVSVILNSVGNDFFSEMKRGFFEAEREYSSYGINLTLCEIKGYKSEDILRAIEKIDEDTKALILTPVNDEKVREKINELTEKGICVITVSSDIEESKRNAYVGCDYLKSGRIAGRLIRLLNKKGASVCIATGSANHKGHMSRVEGIRSYLEDHGNDINIAGVIENQDDNETAYVNTKEFLKSHSNISFVYITAGGVSGTVRAVREEAQTGRKIGIGCFDDTPEIEKAVKSGDIEATICQQPFEQGYNAVKLIFEKIVAKKEIDEFNYTQLIIKVDESM